MFFLIFHKVILLSETRKNKSLKIYWLITAVFLFSISFILPTDSPNIHIGSYSIDKSILKDGDIIFRRGTSFVSNMVLMVDESSPYSHTGIVRISNDSVFVIHSVPAETFSEKDVVKMEPLNCFLIRDRATAIAVCRLEKDDTATATNAARIALDYAKINTPFDSDFNLEDDSELYCTELVWKCYMQSGINLTEDVVENIKIPLKKGPIILPGTLLKSKNLKLIYSQNFL